MSNATGSRTRIAHVVETTWGTTPASPQLSTIPFKSFGLTQTTTVHEDDSIQSDRMVRHVKSGNISVAGPIAVNLSATDFEPFLESLMMNTFDSDVLKVGSTRKSFTIEKAHLDVGQYMRYTGCVVDGMSLSIPADGWVTSTFNMIGKDATMAQSALDASPTAAASTEPFYQGVGTFKIDGVATGIITSMTCEIQNSITASHCLGSRVAVDVQPKNLNVKGQTQVYFTDAAMYDAFINEDNISLEITLTDGTNSLTITMPNVKITGYPATVNDQGTIIVPVPYSAIYDETSATSISFTRS